MNETAYRLTIVCLSLANKRVHNQLEMLILNPNEFAIQIFNRLKKVLKTS